ncbi:hypothetical protein QN277_016935 [Acacia crassicarpa]|uniref:SHSP domain-containing protein n=1 Tax=Acacia crassicarpa TaxID=499986 RepID=A0AAE1MXS3_9FABA|nr:hypothetical protein QN277_016935 [Acacia crassicarpa]
MAESAAAYNVVYEDIEPFFEWHTDEDFHVLVVMLPGFRRDQLKVQVTSTPMLKISAQRQIGGNRWRRVYKEFSVPSDSDLNDINAKFEAGTLKIKFPKLITPSFKPPERDADAHKNNGAQLEDQAKRKIDDQVSEKSQKVEQPTEKGKTDYGVTEKNDVHQEDQEKAKIGDEDSGKIDQKEKEPVAAAAAASDDFSKDKGKKNNGVDGGKAVHEEDREKAKSTTDEVSGKKPAVATVEEAPRDGNQRSKNVSRLKTRLLDFTLSLRPTRAEPEDSYFDYKEALADLVTRLKKMKSLANLIVAALLVVAFVLYLKNAFKQSLEGSEEQEL